MDAIGKLVALRICSIWHFLTFCAPSEAMRVGLGPGVLMSYILQGLVHPARKVREVRTLIAYQGLVTDIDTAAGILADL